MHSTDTEVFNHWRDRALKMALKSWLPTVLLNEEVLGEGSLRHRSYTDSRMRTTYASQHKFSETRGNVLPCLQTPHSAMTWRSKTAKMCRTASELQAVEALRVAETVRSCTPLMMPWGLP